MEKRGQIVWMVLAFIGIIALIVGIATWIQMRGDNNPSTEDNNPPITLINNSEVNSENNISDDISTNNTNSSGTNQSTNNTIISNDFIPNPAGKLTGNDLDEDSGGYFCNETATPIHGLRLYTYKLIDGVKNLSEEYIESKKIDVCDFYDNETVVPGIEYNMDWRWDVVDGIDGYRAYQYYKYEEITRDYDYYIDLQKTATRLYDTGLNLWKSA